MLVTVEGLVRFGAMLANGGINPSTGERIVPLSTVVATTTLMQMCGMYDGAGKFTKDHGVPTKSGVAGGLLSIVPGIGAICTWSPKLNEEGNSVKGIGMVEKLSAKYSNINLFHKDPEIFDLTKQPYSTLINSVITCCEAAASGDLETVYRQTESNPNLVNESDYDKRTPLHLAAANSMF